IDDELPRVGVVERRTGRRPGDDNHHGRQERPLRSDRVGGAEGEAAEALAHPRPGMVRHSHFTREAAMRAPPTTPCDGLYCPTMSNVLDGVRVLDFGRYIAGPYCAALLADLGADVIRIERIGGGEDRWVAPVARDGVGALYLVMNRNKRAMTLDPSSADGREI